MSMRMRLPGYRKEKSRASLLRIPTYKAKVLKEGLQDATNTPKPKSIPEGLGDVRRSWNA